MNQSLNTTSDDYAIVFASPMTIQLNGILPIINNSSNSVNITIGNPGSNPSITLLNVSINNCSAIGGNGGSYLGLSSTGNEGGGGFSGNGGSITTTGDTGSAGGGGFGGDGGDVTFSTDDILGRGGGGGGPSNGPNASGGNDIGKLGGGSGGVGDC
jgi:hypothetical protein